jgi:hypothetical protein
LTHKIVTLNDTKLLEEGALMNQRNGSSTYDKALRQQQRRGADPRDIL